MHEAREGQTVVRHRPAHQQWQMENRIKNLGDIKLNLFQQTCILQTDCDSHRHDRFSPNHRESVPPSLSLPSVTFKITYFSLHKIDSTAFVNIKFSYWTKSLNEWERFISQVSSFANKGNFISVFKRELFTTVKEGRNLLIEVAQLITQLSCLCKFRSVHGEVQVSQRPKQ